MSTTAFSPEIEHQARQQLDALFARSTVDMSFRSRLLSEPNAAYAEQTGNEIPSGVQFKFIEKKDGKMTIVLPPFGSSRPDLSDAELEMVSGGTEPCTLTACAIGVVFVTGVVVGLWAVEKIVN